MQLKILCPQWGGSEHFCIEAFLEKVKQTGFDGVEMPISESKMEKQKLLRLLEDYKLIMASHQHQTEVGNFHSFFICPLSKLHQLITIKNNCYANW